MKIKITDIKKVREFQEILRDMNIKQPTFGYSDVFIIKQNDWDEVKNILTRRSIPFEIVKNQTSESIKDIIRRVIREEINKKGRRDG